MIRVCRPDVTSLPAEVRSALSRRQATANQYAQKDPRINRAWGNFLKSKPRNAIAQALDTCFHCKCAYCEGVAAQDIEHFYPKSQYPGRMFQWDNFLRGCKNCNNFKRDQFPLSPANDPVLLDPCRDDPLDYFVWDFLTGAIGIRPEQGFQERGEATTELLRLNIESLREERRSKFTRVTCLLAQVVNQTPVSAETQTVLREELDARRSWLGIIRQLFRRPGTKYRRLVSRARTKLPDIDQWTAPWL